MGHHHGYVTNNQRISHVLLADSWPSRPNPGEFRVHAGGWVDVGIPDSLAVSTQGPENEDGLWFYDDIPSGYLT
jgi:hypothetical protein